MKKTTKYVLGIFAVLAVGGIAFAFANGGPKETLQTENVKKQDIRRTVLATGTVTSGVNLALSFKVGGVVKRLPVKVGQQIKEGDVLAELDNKQERAAVLQAAGGLSQVHANLQKVIDGASSEDVQVSQVALDNAVRNLNDTKKQQDQLVENARKALLNTGLEAVAKNSNLGTAPVISGVYTGDREGVYYISFYQTGQGLYYSYSGLESGSGSGVNVGSQVKIGTLGLYAVFSPATYASDIWVVEIPNIKALNYLTNLNAFKAAKETRDSSVASVESSVAAAEATLALKKAQARPADIAIARAQITSAQGQVEAAQASLENTIIRAPTGGTVTKVDVKLGELAAAGKIIITVQDISNLYVEANISEANIASLSLGQAVEYTFDALGVERKFMGKVTAIDPASTVVSGVVNYKVTASVDNFTEVRPGMTANMSVAVAEKSNVLAVPLRAIVTKESEKFVRVITDEKKQIYEERKVTTGLEADGGLVEIVSGLAEGQKVVTFVEKK